VSRPQHRHPQDDPSKDPDLRKDHHQGHDELHPGGEVRDRRIPVEGDHRDVQAVEDDAQERADRREFDDPQTAMPNTVGSSDQITKDSRATRRDRFDTDQWVTIPNILCIIRLIGAVILMWLAMIDFLILGRDILYQISPTDDIKRLKPQANAQNGFSNV